MSSIKAKIRVVIAALILVFTVVMMFSFILESDKEVRKLVLVTSIPMFTESGFVDLIDSVSIIYKKDMLLYELMPTYQYNFDKADLLKSKYAKYKYFLLKKGDKYGYLFDSINALKAKRFKTDSILKRSGYLDQSFFKQDKYRRIKTTINKKGFAKMETYIPIESYKNKGCDTMEIFYTSGLKNIEYSLSHYLDSISGLKVCMLKMKFNSKFVKEAGRTIPASEVILILKEDLSNLSQYDVFIKNVSKKQY
ncbi:hypothetical protein [Flavobacterium sp. FlaQc-48]|uniref:hypothetical protein n=1 Tax=Flavobacterium sp. FlaQc-48 TaxID=3374181 RepID=UPI0037578845